MVRNKANGADAERSRAQRALRRAGGCSVKQSQQGRSRPQGNREVPRVDTWSVSTGWQRQGRRPWRRSYAQPSRHRQSFDKLRRVAALDDATRNSTTWDEVTIFEDPSAQRPRLLGNGDDPIVRNKANCCAVLVCSVPARAYEETPCGVTASGPDRAKQSQRAGWSQG